MKITFLLPALVAASAVWTTCIAADNFTRHNVDTSQEIINKTIEAYGGAEKLRAVEQLIVEYDVTNTNAGQSRKPNPPWDVSKGKRTSGFDFANNVVATKFHTQGRGGDFSGINIVNGEDSFNINHQRKTKTKVNNPNFDVAAGPSLRSNGALLAKRLQQFANSARYLGEVDFEGRKHDLIGFTMPGGPAITLYIDQKSHLINKSERVVGPFLVEYYFKDHKNVDGLMLPFENAYTVDGAPAQTFVATKYQVNKPLDPLLKVPQNYVTVEPAPAQPLTTHDLGDGVYWVTQNNQNSLFVEFEDHLMMVGGLPGVTQRIAEIKKGIPNKPVKYAVMTHHHADHIGGSQEISDAKSTFVAARAHEQVIREALKEKDRASAKFELIEDKKVFADKSQRVEIYDIGPTPHTEHFLLAYLPKQKIIFEADHFGVPHAGPIQPRNGNIAAFVDGLKKRGLKVEKIASAHATRMASMQELMESYNSGG